MELAIQSEVAEASLTEPKGDAAAQVCDTVWVERASSADLWLNHWGTDNPVEAAERPNPTPHRRQKRLANGPFAFRIPAPL